MMRRLVRLAHQPGGAGLLDRGHRRPRRGAVALETLLGHVQQEGLGGGDPPLDAVLADRHHLPEHRLVGRLVAPSARAPARVAALPLAEAARGRRPAVADRRAPRRAHRSFAGPSRPAQRSGIAGAALDLGDAPCRRGARRRGGGCSAACTAQGSSSSCRPSKSGPCRSGSWSAMPRISSAASALSGSLLRRGTRSRHRSRACWARQILLALGDHLQDLAPGEAAAGDRVLVGPVLQRLFDGHLARRRRPGSPSASGR